MTSVSFLLLLGALTAVSAQVSQSSVINPIQNIDNLYQAVDVPKMIQDGKAESLYRVQDALKFNVDLNDVTDIYLWGRSKGLTFLLVSCLIDNRLPLHQYGQDVENIIAYLRESGLGLEHIHTWIAEDASVHRPRKESSPPHKPSEERGEEYLPPRKPSQRRGYF